jgi:hypothetical protein
MVFAQLFVNFVGGVECDDIIDIVNYERAVRGVPSSPNYDKLRGTELGRDVVGCRPTTRERQFCPPIA